MKISEILKAQKPTISIEVFPPKTEAAFESVAKAVDEISLLKPAFMSVTYGAGGGTSKKTVEIASHIQNDLGVSSIAHLSCISSTREDIQEKLAALKANGIENILALRGDLPKDTTLVRQDYHYASELIRDIKAQYPDFCIGGACYPEKHPDSPSIDADIRFLKEKVDAGCDFITTQMFFDNNLFYAYLYKLREAGIHIPVIAGIMPVTNGRQLRRIYELSSAYLPPSFMTIVDRFGENPEAMTQAGVAYATNQIIDLIANGIKHIHIYSMNKPEVASAILHNLSHIIWKS